MSDIGNITSSSEQFSARFCSSRDPSCVEFTIQNSGTVNIMGGNVTVTQDEQVEFQCVSSKWFPIPTVSWTWNSEAVNSSLYNTTSIADGDFFNCTSVLKFQAVRDTQIECRATMTLASPQSSSVYLVVVPKPTDWTVLIAVVVSIGSFALLVLLIIGIIFCYKRRKEKSVAPSELTDSGFFPANGSFSEMPDVVNSTHTGNAYLT
ncbi:hypothetical protein F7725_007304, partial [Dissostichus mawsoni]